MNIRDCVWCSINYFYNRCARPSSRANESKTAQWKGAGKWWIKESERGNGGARRRELRAAKGQCAEEWHASAEESNEGEEETNGKRKERQKRVAVDTDEEKEQIYGTEIAGHSVNLALCSYSRQRIKGSGETKEGKRRSSVVFLAGPTSSRSVSITKSCEIVRRF